MRMHGHRGRAAAPVAAQRPAPAPGGAQELRGQGPAPLDLEARAARAALLGHSVLRGLGPPPPPADGNGGRPADTVQRTLRVQTDAGRVRYREKAAVEENVPPETGNRTLVVNMLFYWGQLAEEKDFASWQQAIDQAFSTIAELLGHPKSEEILPLLEAADFDAAKAQELKELLVVQPQATASEDLRATDVQPIDVAEDKVQVPVIGMDGALVETVEYVHPIFREVVQADDAFVIVVLPQGADEETFKARIEYQGKRYRIDLTAGSAIKPGPGRTGRAFGIEESTAEVIKGMFGFEESVYYAQRALFPLVGAGVTGRIRGRAYPQEKGMEHVFLLQDDTPVQVDDGWGYIRKSLADRMAEGGMQFDKRQPRAEAGRASHQMLGWFDDEDLDVVQELVAQGVQRWWEAVQEFEATGQDPTSDAHFESRRVLQSLLTTGKPPMEMGVAMPVTGSDLVVPQGQERYTRNLPGDVSVIRSPADKQNFHPVPQDHVEQHAQISHLVGDIEGIQYTLTGRQDDLLTFFKGMVGVIDDELWPDDWEGVDLVVSSKDRKLFEKWSRDTSLEEEEEEDGGDEVEDPETDRAAMSKMVQDFSVTGTLAAVQWFAQGSFVGVPPAVQKWLGGDYDGDEVAMVFGAQNPALQAYVRDHAFQEEEVNPKLPKTFTHSPGTSRAGRIMAMRSPNVGMWSNIAAQVRSLPVPLRRFLAESTQEDRLLREDDPSLASLDEVGRMEKEIQLGIKVGTDAYKTSVSAQKFEDRAGFYMGLLKTMVQPIAHNKKILEVMDAAGVWPTLQSPAWASIFFRYDEVDSTTGEYVVRGVSARVLRNMIWRLLPDEDKQNINHYYAEWKQGEGFDPRGERVPNVAFASGSIDAYTGDPPGTAQWLIGQIDFSVIYDFDKFVRAFLSVGRRYWRHHNANAFALEQRRDEAWLAGLRPLLKRYYLA